MFVKLYTHILSIVEYETLYETVKQASIKKNEKIIHWWVQRFTRNNRNKNRPIILWRL